MIQKQSIPAEHFYKYMENEGPDMKYVKTITIEYEVNDNPYRGIKLHKKVRGSGNTTRLVDYYVQELFALRGEWVTIVDTDPHNFACTLSMMNKIQRRFEIEHPYIASKLEKIDKITEHVMKLNI